MRDVNEHGILVELPGLPESIVCEIRDKFDLYVEVSSEGEGRYRFWGVPQDIDILIAEARKHERPLARVYAEPLPSLPQPPA